MFRAIGTSGARAGPFTCWGTMRCGIGQGGDRDRRPLLHRRARGGRPPARGRVHRAGRDYRLAAAGGVFSAGRLDPGTAVLLRKADLPAAGDRPAPARPRLRLRADRLRAGRPRRPRRTVWAVDVNARACELAAANAAALGVADRVRVARAGRGAGGRRRSPRSGPTRRSGSARPSCTRCCERWLPRLAPDGVGLAGGRPAPRRRLAAALAREQGWQVERHASQKGFRVLRVDAGKSGRRDAGRRPGRILTRGIRGRRRGRAHPARRPGALRRRVVPGRRGRQGRAGRAERRRQDHAAADGRRRPAGAARARSRAPAGWA